MKNIPTFFFAVTFLFNFSLAEYCFEWQVKFLIECQSNNEKARKSKNAPYRMDQISGGRKKKVKMRSGNDPPSDPPERARLIFHRPILEEAKNRRTNPPTRAQGIIIVTDWRGKTGGELYRGYLFFFFFFFFVLTVSWEIRVSSRIRSMGFCLMILCNALIDV